MCGNGAGGAGVHVRGRADLERDSSVAHEVRQSPEVVVAVLFDDVVGDAHPVAEPFGVAELHGLPDRGQAEGLAGVDRHVKVLALHEMKGA